MENFMSRLRNLIQYHDTEPLEIMGGVGRIAAPLHFGMTPCTLSLAITGVISIATAWGGNLRWRGISNLIGVTVPIALLMTDVKGWDSDCLPNVVFTLIISAWSLIRTMSEMNSRGTK